MPKLYIVLFVCLTTLKVAGQNIDKSDIQEPVSGGSAINIAVSRLDIADGSTYYDEALEQERKGDFNDALNLFVKAAFEFNSAKDFNRYGQAILKLSHMHYMLGRFNDAEQVLLNVALKNYSKIGSKPGLMNSYSLLGKVYLAGNKYTQAMWFYTQQGILAKQTKNNNAYIESVLGLAQVKIKKKDFTLATRDLNQAEWLARSVKNTQYNGQIKDARLAIATKTTGKK